METEIYMNSEDDVQSMGEKRSAQKILVEKP
jgi:hypothetical protein